MEPKCSLGAKLFLYAGESKEKAKWRPVLRSQPNAANVRCHRSRRFERNVQVDEQSGVAQNGQDQAQGETHAQGQEKVEHVSADQTVARAEDSHFED